MGIKKAPEGMLRGLSPYQPARLELALLDPQGGLPGVLNLQLAWTHGRSHVDFPHTPTRLCGGPRPERPPISLTRTRAHA